MPIMQDGNPNPDRIRFKNVEKYRVYKGSHLVWQKETADPGCVYDCTDFLSRGLLNHYPFLTDQTCLIQGSVGAIANPVYSGGLIFPDGGYALPDAERTKGPVPTACDPYAGEDMDVDADVSGWTVENAKGYTVCFWVTVLGPVFTDSIVPSLVVMAGEDGVGASVRIVNDPNDDRVQYGVGYSGSQSYYSFAPIHGQKYRIMVCLFYDPINDVIKYRMGAKGGGLSIERGFATSILYGADTIATSYYFGVPGTASWLQRLQVENVKVEDFRIYPFPFVEKDSCGNYAEFSCEYQRALALI